MNHSGSVPRLGVLCALGLAWACGGETRGARGGSGGSSASGGSASGGSASGGNPSPGGSGGASTGGSSEDASAGSGGTSAGGADAAASTGGTFATVDGASTCWQTIFDPTFSNNYCSNSSDRCWLEANAQIFRAESLACSVSNACISYIFEPEKPDAVKCVTDCLTSVLGGALSVECEQCGAKVAACSNRNCAQPCMVASNPQDCQTCLCTSHPAELGGLGGSCIDVFADCAGFELNTAFGCGN